MNPLDEDKLWLSLPHLRAHDVSTESNKMAWIRASQLFSSSADPRIASKQPMHLNVLLRAQLDAIVIAWCHFWEFSCFAVSEMVLTVTSMKLYVKIRYDFLLLLVMNADTLVGLCSIRHFPAYVLSNYRGLDMMAKVIYLAKSRCSWRAKMNRDEQVWSMCLQVDK